MDARKRTDEDRRFAELPKRIHPDDTVVSVETRTLQGEPDDGVRDESARGAPRNG